MIVALRTGQPLAALLKASSQEIATWVELLDEIAEGR